MSDTKSSKHQSLASEILQKARLSAQWTIHDDIDDFLKAATTTLAGALLSKADDILAAFKLTLSASVLDSFTDAIVDPQTNMARLKADSATFLADIEKLFRETFVSHAQPLGPMGRLMA